MLKRSLIAVAFSLVATTAIHAQGDITPQQFVDRVATSDMFEIESSRLAVQRGQLPATRSFAEHMITDHSAGSTRLAQVIAGSSLTVPMALDSEHEKMLARLNAASPAEFDATYISNQKTGHKAAVELFTNYAATGSEPALRAFAAEMLPLLRNHQNEVQVMN
jgi:putative membrane protein